MIGVRSCPSRDQVSSQSSSLKVMAAACTLTSTEVGELPLEGVPFDLSATPPDTGGTIHRGPPDLDEDRDYVLREVLGLDDDAVTRLVDAGALR